MYNVLLSKDILQSTREFISRIALVLNDNDKDDNVPVRIPAGTLELAQSLIARAEDDWHHEEAQFQRFYRDTSFLEEWARDAITRVTVASELLIKCFYVITYRMEIASREQLNSLREPFVKEACRLLRLINRMATILQLTRLEAKVEHRKPDLFMRKAETELLFVLKLRLSYAEHLADVAVRIWEMYQSTIPSELLGMRLRARVHRNTAAVLIECARAEEQYQKELLAMYHEFGINKTAEETAAESKD